MVVHRLPIMLERSWRAEAREILRAEEEDGAESLEQEIEALTRIGSQNKSYNLAWPGSHCPRCGKNIRWWHNIPVVSWLLLRGRCADCSQPIPVRYPLVELTCGALGMACYLWFEPNYLQVVAMSCFCWALVAMAVIDMETGYLPDELTLSLMWGGLLYNLYSGSVPLPDAVLGAVAGYGSLWLLATGFRLVRGIEGMGGGDMKMLAMIGAWFGWKALPAALLVGCFAMLLYASLLMLFGRNARVLRFGPGLSLAGLWALYAHFHPDHPLTGIYNFQAFAAVISV